MDQTAVKQEINTVIFGTETPAGKRFDLILIYAILISVVAVTGVAHFPGTENGALPE